MRALIRIVRALVSLACLAVSIAAIVRGFRVLFAGSLTSDSGLNGMGSSVGLFVVGVIALWAAMELFPKPPYRALPNGTPADVTSSDSASPR